MTTNQLNVEYIKATGYIANSTLPGNTPEHFKLIWPTYILHKFNTVIKTNLIIFHFINNEHKTSPNTIGNME